MQVSPRQASVQDFFANLAKASPKRSFRGPQEIVQQASKKDMLTANQKNLPQKTPHSRTLM